MASSHLLSNSFFSRLSVNRLQAFALKAISIDNEAQNIVPSTTQFVGKTFKRITGSDAQAFQFTVETPYNIKYMNEDGTEFDELIKTKKDNEIINEHIIKKSTSTTKSSFSNNYVFIKITEGTAEEKFDQKNVTYTAYHMYITINNKAYYSNIYWFNNGQILFAIYEEQ